jgi:hypothetical protein
MQIIRNLRVGDPNTILTKESRIDLMNAARVCRSFRELAIPLLLWESHMAYIRQNNLPKYLGAKSENFFSHIRALDLDIGSMVEFCFYRSPPRQHYPSRYFRRKNRYRFLLDCWHVLVAASCVQYLKLSLASNTLHLGRWSLLTTNDSGLKEIVFRILEHAVERDLRTLDIFTDHSGFRCVIEVVFKTRVACHMEITISDTRDFQPLISPEGMTTISIFSDLPSLSLVQYYPEFQTGLSKVAKLASMDIDKLLLRPDEKEEYIRVTALFPAQLRPDTLSLPE